MHSFFNFKKNNKVGDVLSLKVFKVVPPGLILFNLTNNINGSIHISELNWNFGLSQRDFNQINIDDTIKVYISDFVDKNKRVIFGRKNLIEKTARGTQILKLICQ